MKMKRYLASGVLLLCLMTSQIARADEKRNAKIKAEMIENYLLWQEALKIKDAERVISFTSQDFALVESDGSVRNKQKADDYWRDVMNGIEKVHQARKQIKSLNIEPHRVVIVSDQYLDVDMKDSGQLHRVVWTIRAREIWVQYDNAWMLKRITQERPKFIIDGKEIIS